MVCVRMCVCARVYVGVLCVASACVCRGVCMFFVRVCVCVRVCLGCVLKSADQFKRVYPYV